MIEPNFTVYNEILGYFALLLAVPSLVAAILSALAAVWLMIVWIASEEGLG
jgi:hypothetical protein